MTYDTVSDIAEDRLCCSCGACAWACPEQAIQYTETVGGYLVPKVSERFCTHCGICTAICPGVSLVPSVTDRLPADPFVGTALETWVGKAADRELYANSQSGGIVSALLCYAIGTGDIRGAVTTAMVKGNPPRSRARLACNTNAIKEAQKSKYCPVPVLSALEEVDRLGGPAALVGVACQIHGLGNLCERFPRITDKIRLTIGLVCDRVMTYAAIAYLVKRAGMPSRNVMLHYRDKACGGYPGNVSVLNSTGQSVTLPARERTQIKDFFTPARCRLCFDKMNIFADIVIGDPHGVDGVDRAGGESVSIIRTERGRTAFQNALKAGAITAREIPFDQVVAGQRIELKRTQWQGYVDAWKSLPRPLPDYCDLVSRKGTKSSPEGPYKDHLRHALMLDSHPSIDALIASAEAHVRSKRIKKKLKAPLRMLRRLALRLKGETT